MYCIRYNKIPDKWINGLPIGNGRLAAMYWGDGGRDILSLNNEYLWRGKHRNRTCEYAADKLPQLRDLLKNRDYFRATVFANLFFGGYNGDSGISEGGIDSFQPAGDIVFEFSEITKDCSCMLDIENGLITAERASAVRGEFFCDCNDGQIMTAWKNENGFDGKLSFRRCDDPEAKYNTVYGDNKITFFCSFICGICFEVIISIKTDGCTKVLSDGIYIKNAKEVICSTNIVLSDNDKRETDLDFEKLYLNHSKKFASYMHRMSFEIDADEPHICTDERIRRIRQGESDVKLQELFFHYGRYLMISSCISGKLPPNLQGKWNGEIDPPWGCDYHFDINLQMNEWMIEGADLSEFAEALTDFLLELIDSGREAAKSFTAAAVSGFRFQPMFGENARPKPSGILYGRVPRHGWHRHCGSIIYIPVTGNIWKKRHINFSGRLLCFMRIISKRMKTVSCRLCRVSLLKIAFTALAVW